MDLADPGVQWARPSPGQGRSQATSSGDHLTHPLRGSQLFPGARREGERGGDSVVIPRP